MRGCPSAARPLHLFLRAEPGRAGGTEGGHGKRGEGRQGAAGRGSGFPAGPRLGGVTGVLALPRAPAPRAEAGAGRARRGRGAGGRYAALAVCGEED